MHFILSWILLLWDSWTLCGKNCDCLNGPTELGEASPHYISTTWFFMASRLLPECNFVCVFLHKLYFGWSFSKLGFFSMVTNISSIAKGTTKWKVTFSMYKTVHIYKSQSLMFQCHKQRNQQRLQNMNSPDSTTSLSGVVAGCGEKERSGLAVQPTLLLFNMQRLWFHLPVAAY
jgi:hypothetical protein